jgi:hypothetical protein
VTPAARPRAEIAYGRTAAASVRLGVRGNPRGSRRRSLALACLLIGMPALAEAGEAALREVVVTTRIVMASNNGKANLQGADTAPLRESLRLFHYSSYRLVQHEVRPVSMTKMVEFPVPGERHLLVQPTEFKNGRVSLHVMLMEGRKMLVNTALKLKNGGEFVVAGPHHEDGVLFLAIGAKMADGTKRDADGLRRASGNR